MTNEQANIFCYIFTGMSMKEFALKMLKDLDEEKQSKIEDNEDNNENKTL